MSGQYAGFRVYTDLVGKLLINLQGLEANIRNYLYERADGNHVSLPRPLHSYRVGDLVPESALTDYSSMGQLIDRYNVRVCAAKRPDLALDGGIVAIRDALAHGRIYVPAESPDAPANGPPVIIKFDKPTGGVARLSFFELASDDWLTHWVAEASRMSNMVTTALHET